MQLKELMISLCSLMSVSGYENMYDEKLMSLVGSGFDESYTDALHNHVFIKRSGKEHVPKILIDTHFDEIGMIVTRIHDSGFLSIAAIGGVDTRILQAGEVIVYGKRPIYGVIASTPPHLQKSADSEKLKPIDELYIDTGLTKSELEELVRIGSPVGFKPVLLKLANKRLCGKGFDDKACAACAIAALMNVPREKLAGDVYLLLSAEEEVGLRGAKVGGFGIDPDYALVLDVTHAHTPDSDVSKDLSIGNGISVTMSSVTDKRLTSMLMELCRVSEIKYNVEVSPMSTGTNANVIGITAEGIPTILVNLPIKSMHSSAEVLGLDDAGELQTLVERFVCSDDIAEVFGR